MSDENFSCEEVGQAIADALEHLTVAQRVHFQQLCAGLLRCYIDANHHGFVLLGDSHPLDPSTSVNLRRLTSVNSTEFQAMQMLTACQTHVGILADATPPPREMYS